MGARDRYRQELEADNRRIRELKAKAYKEQILAQSQARFDAMYTPEEQARIRREDERRRKFQAAKARASENIYNSRGLRRLARFIGWIFTITGVLLMIQTGFTYLVLPDASYLSQLFIGAIVFTVLGWILRRRLFRPRVYV